MHEKVLSTSTLEKAFKKKKGIQTSATHLNVSPKNTSVLLWDLSVLLCHSDLTAPVTVEPTALILFDCLQANLYYIVP